MVRISLCVMLLSILTLSCNKESTGISSSNVETLVGKWQWLSSYGGIAGQLIAPPAGTKVILTYTSDGMFFQSRNDTLQASSGYIVKKDRTMYSDDSLRVVVFQDTTLWKQVILHMSADTLGLGDNFYDGYSSVYRRVSQ